VWGGEDNLKKHFNWTIKINKRAGLPKKKRNMVIILRAFTQEEWE
jgi:hypothetical protein